MDELLDLYPNDLFVAWIHEGRAQAFVDLGEPEGAIEALHQAMAAQRQQTNVKGYAALAYAELVVSLRRNDLFEQAIMQLDELHDRGPFPAIHYREDAARALIAEAQGDLLAARAHARAALVAAATAEAPFTRHPDVGLVRRIEPDLHARLEALAAA